MGDSMSALWEREKQQPKVSPLFEVALLIAGLEP